MNEPVCGRCGRCGRTLDEHDDDTDDTCPGWRQSNLCAGRRLNGSPCNRFASPGSRYCYEHPAYHDVTPPAPTRPPWIDAGTDAHEWTYRKMGRP